MCINEFYKLLFLFIFFQTGLMFFMDAFAKTIGAQYYGTGLCDKENYKCITIKKATSWKKFLPNKHERDIVQRLNRSNTYLYKNRKIVVPINLEGLSLMDISPFDLNIPYNQKMIVVDQDKLAWAAYNEKGKLVKWGPISSGKDYCSDIKRSCLSITGTFNVFSIKGKECRSNTFPIGRGGSHMPYCMFFYRGFALHGSLEMVGYRDSHGCIRLFTKDAKWLNEKFVSTGNSKTGLGGTKVIIQALNTNKGNTNIYINNIHDIVDVVKKKKKKKKRNLKKWWPW